MAKACLRCCGALLIGVMLGSCAQQTAEIPNEPVVPSFNGDETEEPAAASNASTPSPTVADDPESVSSESPGSAPLGSEPAETESAAGSDAVDPTEDFVPGAVSAKGAELGCEDATSTRTWLADSAPEVAAAAADMPLQLWLCPATDEVQAALECYPDQTAAVLTALSDTIGDAVAALVEEIEQSGTTFCASGDVVRLGLDALLERDDSE